MKLFSIDGRWLVMVLLASLLISMPLAGQRAGQSATIQYGHIKSAKQVDLKSGAVPKGALVGGGLGLLSGSGKSSGAKVRNTLIGAVAGGVIAGKAQGSQSGMLYAVDIGSGGEIQVVTDQKEIRTDDCVAVEKVGETANIRRVSAAYCEKTNSDAIKAVRPEAEKDAEECLLAKQQLVDANTTEQADLAERKITLLCND